MGVKGGKIRIILLSILILLLIELGFVLFSQKTPKETKATGEKTDSTVIVPVNEELITESSQDIAVIETVPTQEQETTLTPETETQPEPESISEEAQTFNPIQTAEPISTSVPEAVPTPPPVPADTPKPPPKPTKEPEIISKPSQEPEMPESIPSQEDVQVHQCVFENVETAATCEKNGSIEERCSMCGAIRSTKDIPSLGHDFVKSVWETATCLKNGYYNSVCKRCGRVEMTTESPLPHEVENIVVQEGNCMEDRVIRHICKMCGLQAEPDTRYTVEEHSWTREAVDGMEVTVCQWCGVVQ